MAQEIQAHKNSFIKKTFITTADENYLVARSAFFLGCYTDFFWLSLHALEKYFKAVLLLNGFASKGYGHDIKKLYKHSIRNIDCFSLPQFQRPSQFDDELWIKDPIDKYLKRLNIYGDPNNRYMLYGYHQMQSDLIKIDHLVWHIRRFCKPRFLSLADKEIDQYKLLKKSDQWSIDKKLPVEKAFDEENKVLLNLNYSFAPEKGHHFSKYKFSSKNPPLIRYIESLRNPEINEHTEKVSIEFLKWVLENIHLNKRDGEILEDLTKGPNRHK